MSAPTRSVNPFPLGYSGVVSPASQLQPPRALAVVATLPIGGVPLPPQPELAAGEAPAAGSGPVTLSVGGMSVTLPAGTDPSAILAALAGIGKGGGGCG